jgi:hypothetical protein
MNASGCAGMGRLRRLAVACAALPLILLMPLGWTGGPTAQAPAGFAAHVSTLSERGGYFDTDNLISNERSYLQVLPDLRRAGLQGGAYIGVGPDTSFSYIADLRPAIAFIIDVRRDNMLLHLLFKALFALSGTRVEYLANLLGRPVPAAVDGWRSAPIDRLATYFDRTASRPDMLPPLRRRIETKIRETGVSLTPEDLATIARFHARFVGAGLDLRFNTSGRPPQYYYPTYRDLLLETDASGQRANYLSSEDAFQFLRTLQARDLVIPVVGDLAGPSALTSIGRMLTARGERMSAFYTSNVEFYLYGQGTYAQFLANLRAIPHTKNSVIIRSVFGRYLGHARPGDGSTSQLHAVDDLLNGAARGQYRSYGELVGRGSR